MCVGGVCEYKCTGMPEVSDPLKLGLQVVVIHNVGENQTEPNLSSARAVSTLH